MEKTIYEELLDSAKTLLTQDGHIMPVFFLFREGKISHLLGAPFNDEEDKYKSATTAGYNAQQRGCDVVAFICDAAMKEYDGPVEDYDPVTEAPLTYPKSMRQECLVLFVINLKTESAEMYIAPYKDTEEGPVFEDIQKEDSPGGDIQYYILRGAALAKESARG